MADPYSFAPRWRRAVDQVHWFDVRSDLIPAVVIGVATVIAQIVWASMNKPSLDAAGARFAIVCGLAALVAYFLVENGIELLWRLAVAGHRNALDDEREAHRKTQVAKAGMNQHERDLQQAVAWVEQQRYMINGHDLSLAQVLVTLRGWFESYRDDSMIRFLLGREYPIDQIDEATKQQSHWDQIPLGVMLPDLLGKNLAEVNESHTTVEQDEPNHSIMLERALGADVSKEPRYVRRARREHRIEYRFSPLGREVAMPLKERSPGIHESQP